ncbi:MAG: IS630 family transposase [Calditrichia bacterium]|nr:IS630 family transposase [Calditrichia bacterium]
MMEIDFIAETIEDLYYWRYHHPHPRVQLKMEVLYLKSQGVALEEILRLCWISKASFYRYLREYQEGDIEKLKELNFYRPQSELSEHRGRIEDYFRKHPFVTIAEACTRIEELTGIKRGLTQVRKFLKSLGMKPLKVGQIPAKADIEEQEQFKTHKLEPRLQQAKAGKRVVLFMDAAHFVFAPFLGIIWCFERLFVKAPSGRQRLNILAALNAITQEVFMVKNLTYITAQTVCELLRMLAAAYSGMPITIILDNARYQRCALVESLAKKLNIELLFLPPYSPNLNLIERFWKFVKKKCLYSKYYPDHQSFQQAILECIEQAPTKYREELKSLLTLKFQTFKAVPVIGEESTLCRFPITKQKQIKVSSNAA